MPLVHEYDAAARRAYYLRTRNLKGRTRGVTPTTGAARRAAAKAAKLKKRKALESKIELLQFRLDRLREVLRVLVDKAQARSGTKDTQPKRTPQQKPQTAKQEAAARKASEKYAKENKAEIKRELSLSGQAAALTEKIKAIEARIKKLRQKS